jgi:hypothetical protein
VAQNWRPRIDRGANLGHKIGIVEECASGGSPADAAILQASQLEEFPPSKLAGLNHAFPCGSLTRRRSLPQKQK